jgi:hypothetical protein
MVISTFGKSDPFDSAVRSWQRGQHHVLDFVANVKVFLDKKPWTYTVETNPHGYKSHVIRFNKPPDPILESIATDAAYNLRAALDQCAYAATLVSKRKFGKDTHFPFGNAGRDGARIRGTRSAELPPEIVSLFRSYKPYKGGNDTLWALNTICNTNKHRFLTTTNYLGNGATSHWAQIESLEPIWDSEKGHLIFEHLDGTAHRRTISNLPLYIVFKGIEKIDGKPAIPLLDEMCNFVGWIIGDTQRECARLGWINLVILPPPDGRLPRGPAYAYDWQQELIRGEWVAEPKES